MKDRRALWRDTQRQRVYQWCWTACEQPSDPILCREAILLIVEHLAQVWGLSRIPDVVLPQTGNAHGSIKTLRLPPWARTVPIILHEMAHAIQDELGHPNAAWHGPEFVRIYIDLLAEHARGRDRKTLEREALKLGVRFLPHGDGIQKGVSRGDKALTNPDAES